MTLQAGFAEIEITPPPGTRKIGWIRVIHGTRVLDPLYARVAVFECQGQRAAFVQLDTLSVRAPDTQEIRRRVEAQYGFPGARVMVTATHNHAGPAVASIGDVQREPAYCETLIEKIVSCFGQALERSEAAELAFGSVNEFRVGFNRRVVMRDGLVKTQGKFSDPQALCLEGPVDPEVAVIAARKPGGAWLGALINYACHPTDHGYDECFSAGWPGKLADALKARGCPCPLYINGAQGNIVISDPERDGQSLSMPEIGEILAAATLRAVEKALWRKEVRIGARSEGLELPFRSVSEDEIRGRIRGAQRFVDPTLYDKNMDLWLSEMRQEGAQRMELQTIFLDEYTCIGIPAEFFVELGLRIKEGAHPRHALIFGLANGMVGYVPTREAFARGGYETTFCGWSKLAHDAGDRIVAAALAQCRAE